MELIGGFDRFALAAQDTPVTFDLGVPRHGEAAFFVQSLEIRGAQIQEGLG